MFPSGCAVRFTLLASTAPFPGPQPPSQAGSREAGRKTAWLHTAPPRPESGRRLATGTGGPGAPRPTPSSPEDPAAFPGLHVESLPAEPAACPDKPGFCCLFIGSLGRSARLRPLLIGLS